MARTVAPVAAPTTVAPVGADEAQAAADVRARLARCWRARASQTASLGEFTLRPSQLEAVAMIHRALRQFGGALLADPPGTGKTVIALAVARDVKDVLVAAPAALRAQWELAAQRANVRVRFISLERLSQGATVARAPLVIVDEAHQVRTPQTRRYARLADLTVGARVLLLTATPVVNGAPDRSALLALFLGARAETLDAHIAARVIIRREQLHAPRPSVRRAPRLGSAADVPGVGEALGALPPPLPAADGSAALALIQLTLAMAWASSLAALEAALRRRAQRGGALADALRDGRWPSRAALREWVLGDDATQLAMPLLLVPDSSAPPPDAMATLDAHLRAVHRLRALIKLRIARDTSVRADGLVALARAHPNHRIVVFAQHAATIDALYRALRAEPGVVALTGAGVRTAGGRWARGEVLRALGPGAPPYSAADPRAIRILLTTDLLSEGVELPGIGIVVHGDSAWTPARLEQRVGRAARVGGGLEVLVTRFEIPQAVGPWLALGARLRRKACARSASLQSAAQDERLGSLLRMWAASSDDWSLPQSARVAAVVSPQSGFIAAVCIDGQDLLIGGRRSARGWSISESPARLLALCRHAEGSAIPIPDGLGNEVRRALGRWTRRHLSRSQVGAGSRLDPETLRAVRRRLSQLLASTPLASRAAIAATCTRLLGSIVRSGGVGLSRALRVACAQAPSSDALIDALRALAAAIAADTVQHQGEPASHVRLRALLLLVAAGD